MLLCMVVSILGTLSLFAAYQYAALASLNQGVLQSLQMMQPGLLAISHLVLFRERLVRTQTLSLALSMLAFFGIGVLRSSTEEENAEAKNKVSVWIALMFCKYSFESQ